LWWATASPSRAAFSYPVDFQVSAGRTLNVIDFLPTAEAFQKTEMAWRETIGRVYYEFKGF
jgi:uncharacterized SAM-binding protein YcdF (DUF218 family)